MYGSGVFSIRAGDVHLGEPYVAGIGEDGCSKFPEKREAEFDVRFKLDITCLARDYECVVQLRQAWTDAPGGPASQAAGSPAVELLLEGQGS